MGCLCLQSVLRKGFKTSNFPKRSQLFSLELWLMDLLYMGAALLYSIWVSSFLPRIFSWLVLPRKCLLSPNTPSFLRKVLQKSFEMRGTRGSNNLAYLSYFGVSSFKFVTSHVDLHIQPTGEASNGKSTSSERMEIGPDLNLPPDFNLPLMVCHFNTHQLEAPEQDVLVGFTAPTCRDGPVVPNDTEKLLFERQRCGADLPVQDASTGSTPPINRDVYHANRVVDVAGAIVPANTEKLLARKRRHQVEVPSHDAYDHANGVAYVSGAIVADTKKILFEKQQCRADLPAQDALIDFVAPIIGVNHVDGVADVARVTAPVSTEKLLSRQGRHRVEEPAQDSCIGFTAPISRDVNHATGVAEVAGASADIEKLSFEKHRQFWDEVESFEACKKMPQDPHFLPLKSCKEIVREGNALGKMVTYNNIVMKILNFRLDTGREEIKEYLSILEDLETHGFKVQILKDRLNRILMLKNDEEKEKNLLEQKKRVLSVHVQENCKFKEMRAKAEERVKKLQKDFELTLEMEKNIDAKKASVLQAEGGNGEKRGRINMQIEQLIASPLAPDNF